MSHGGKLSTAGVMGEPRFIARLGEKIAEDPTVPIPRVREALREVEAARDTIAAEVQADSAALAEAQTLRRDATARGPLAWARGRVYLSSTLDSDVRARDGELAATKATHESLLRSFQSLTNRLK